MRHRLARSSCASTVTMAPTWPRLRLHCPLPPFPPVTPPPFLFSSPLSPLPPACPTPPDKVTPCRQVHCGGLGGLPSRRRRCCCCHPCHPHYGFVGSRCCCHRKFVSSVAPKTNVSMAPTLRRVAGATTSSISSLRDRPATVATLENGGGAGWWGRGRVLLPRGRAGGQGRRRLWRAARQACWPACGPRRAAAEGGAVLIQLPHKCRSIKGEDTAGVGAVVTCGGVRAGEGFADCTWGVAEMSLPLHAHRWWVSSASKGGETLRSPGKLRWQGSGREEGGGQAQRV